MKHPVLACLAAGFVSLVAHAGPTEAAVVAAMKLPDAANYTWVTTVDDDARSYEISGKTDKASDYSIVEMPVVAALRRGVSRGSSVNNDATVVFKGDEKYVVQVDTTWKTPEELAPANSSGGYRGYGGMGGWGGRRGRRGLPPPTTDDPPVVGGDGSGLGPNGRPTLAYSNLQKTLSRPHEEIGISGAGDTEIKAEGDIITGTLNETSAKLLLVHAGQKEITPLKATGTFRLWIKDGALVKYEVKLEGTIAVEIRGDRHEIVVHQTATTTLSGVGVTKVEVPDEAIKKLGT
jgi:hypothetical protein